MYSPAKFHVALITSPTKEKKIYT